MTSAESNNQQMQPETPPEIKVYTRRWLMLLIFCGCNMWNSFHWIQYSIITNIIVKYYSVPAWAVDWLSIVFMVSYLVLIFPVMFFLDKKGLKLTVLIGAFSMALGSWIKVLSVSPDRFYVTFIGQTISSVSEAFLYRSPPRLAALWFGPEQVSTACAIGVVSSQLGTAAGFLVPTLVVTDSANVDDIGKDLSILFYVSSIVGTILFLLVLFFFQNAPPTPPSPARAAALVAEETNNYKATLKNLITNGGFVLLLLANSLVSSAVDAENILLNQIILMKFPGNHEDTGRLGLGNIFCGIIGAVLVGVWLDKTHRFKSSGVALSGLYFIGLIGFAFSVHYKFLTLVYFFFLVSGFTYGAYLALAYEYGVELTYPEPEGTVGGLLNIGTFVFAIGFVSLGGWILRTFQDFTATMFFAALGLVAFLLMAFIKGDLKRLAKQISANGIQDSKPHSEVQMEVRNSSSGKSCEEA